MAKSSSRRASKRTQPTRRHARRRSATSGKILPPLDVRSPEKMDELVKRIRQGPLTLVLIYADWCGHCHELMPHWDRAANSSGRNIQAVKINDSVLSLANETIRKNVNQSAPEINVEGYPTIRMLDQNGETLTDIEPTKDTKTLSRIMNESAKLAEQAGLTEAPTTIAPINRGSNAKNVAEKVASLSAVPASANSLEPAAMTLGTNSYVSMQSIPSASGASEATGLTTMNIGADEEAVLVQPTSMSEDLEASNTSSLLPNRTIRGGSLFGALSRTAYTLAPAAVLLAVASKTMKRRPRKGNRRTRHYRRRR